MLRSAVGTTASVPRHHRMHFFYSTHGLCAVTATKVNGAILHFKFVGDFHERVEIEVARGEPYDDAGEYRAYAGFMGKEGKGSLMSDFSVRLEDSAQLVKLGFMQTDKTLEQSVRFTQAGRGNSALPAA